MPMAALIKTRSKHGKTTANNTTIEVSASAADTSLALVATGADQTAQQEPSKETLNYKAVKSFADDEAGWRNAIKFAL